MNSLRAATQSRSLRSYNFIPRFGSTYTIRAYTNNPRYPNDEKERTQFESAHHDYLSNVLKGSSDEDWSSPAVQNHSENITNHIHTPASSNEQLWEDLVKDN
ncbi:hypothetical protein K7432_000182 [Basidiobolus ranarum]|uniref:Uncharacterized protein n=1 Tax=Basidiobolus ranarum TaxID=34480 RepID=A0ABR2X534_9FUNG